MLAALQHFVHAIDAGTFTEAARRSFITQPALSASIRKLEEQLGARLLDRGRHGARPTAAGLALLPKARLALAAVEDGRRAVAEIEGLHAGEVRLGAGPTACTYLLPDTLSAYRARHPGVRFFLKEAHSPVTWDALGRGELDLGLVTGTTVPAGPGWWTAEPCIDDELVVVRGPDPDVQGWICFPRGSALRGLLDAAFDEPDVVVELGSIAAIKGNVRAGVGRALISTSAVQRDLADGTLVRVKDPRTPLHRTLHLVHRGVDRLPPAAAEMRRLLLAARPTGARV